MKTDIVALVKQIIQPVLDAEQIELVDVEFVKEGSNKFLRVYIDTDIGIDIDQCGRISEFLSERLDELDPIPDAYFLEVSSPGAERALKQVKDYYKAVGKSVFITVEELVNGWTELEGKLVAFDGETLLVQVGKKEHNVAYSNVTSARLAITF